MTHPNPINEESSIEEIQHALGSGFLNHDEYRRLIDIWNEKHTPVPVKRRKQAAEVVAEPAVEPVVQVASADTNPTRVA